MSRVTKRKHVVRELLEERVEPAPRQRIVRVLGTPGNNLHEVETAEGTRFLASMPPRFRHHVWIKRGDFLLVDPIEEGAKVKAEMSLLLLPPHIRFLRRQGLWPEAFAPMERPRESSNPPGEDEDLFVNTNRAGDTRDSEEDTRGSEEEEDTRDSEEEDTHDKDDMRDSQEDTHDSENMDDKEKNTHDIRDTHNTKNTCDVEKHV